VRGQEDASLHVIEPVDRERERKREQEKNSARNRANISTAQPYKSTEKPSISAKGLSIRAIWAQGFRTTILH